MKRFAFLVSLASALALHLGALTARAQTVVQVPLDGVLDGRSVTTLTDGQIVVWTLKTDGGDLQNAFATKAVAIMQGAPPENSLPDDGFFPADDRHPDVYLNFSNDADSASPQTHLVLPADTLSFDVPNASYSNLYLFFNGAAGGTTIHVTLTFSDGTETYDATVPDYYADISPTDPVIFNLATDLAKWDANTQINEANHHNITGVELTPVSTAPLLSVDVTRELEGNLVFWGATGIATSDPPMQGTGGASAMAGAGGAQQMAGTGGALGVGGAVASAGMAAMAGAAGSALMGAGTAGGAPVASSGGMPATDLGALGGGVAAGTAAGNANTSPVVTPVATPTASNDAGCSVGLGGSSKRLPIGAWLLIGVACAARRRRTRHSAGMRA